MGMRNHEYVPIHLIEKISHLKRSNSFNVLKSLQKNKFDIKFKIDILWIKKV